MMLPLTPNATAPAILAEAMAPGMALSYPCSAEGQRLEVGHLDEDRYLEPDRAVDRHGDYLGDGIALVADTRHTCARGGPVVVRIRAAGEVGRANAAAESAIIVLNLDLQLNTRRAVGQEGLPAQDEGFTRIVCEIEEIEIGTMDTVHLEVVQQLTRAKVIAVIRDRVGIKVNRHVALQRGAELTLGLSAACPENVEVGGVGDQAADEAIEAGQGATTARDGDHIRAAGEDQIGVRVEDGLLGAGLYRPDDCGVVGRAEPEATARSCDEGGRRRGGRAGTPQEAEGNHDEGEAQARDCGQRPRKVNELHERDVILS